jgi:hypothetical protein
MRARGPSVVVFLTKLYIPVKNLGEHCYKEEIIGSFCLIKCGDVSYMGWNMDTNCNSVKAGFHTYICTRQ